MKHIIAALILVAVCGNAVAQCINGPCDSVANRDANIPEYTTSKAAPRLNVYLFANSDWSSPLMPSENVDDTAAVVNSLFDTARIAFNTSLVFINSDSGTNIDDVSDWRYYSYFYGVQPDSAISLLVRGDSLGGGMAQPTPVPNRWTDISVTGSNSRLWAHELGHVLGLHHTFAANSLPCDSCRPISWETDAYNDTLGDYCSETPPGPAQVDSNWVPSDTCNLDDTINGTYMDLCADTCWEDQSVNIVNIMSYSQNAKKRSFVPQQAGRMWCALRTYLSQLCDSVPEIVAKDTIIDNFVVDTITTNQGNPLGVPRQHVVTTDDGGLVVFTPGYGSENLFYAADIDSGWNDTLDLSGGSGEPTDVGDHTHMSIDWNSGAADTIFTASPGNSGGDSINVKAIAVGASSLSLVRTVPTANYSGVGDQAVFRASAWDIPGTDTLLVITRGHDAHPDDHVMDISYFRSADHGATLSDSIRLVDWSGTSSQNRIGGLNYLKADGTNYTVSAVLYQSTDSITWWNYNRTDYDWDKVTPSIPHRVFRQYSATVFQDTLMVVAYTHEHSDSIGFAYRSINAASWTRKAHLVNSVRYDFDGISMNLAATNSTVYMFYMHPYYEHRDSIFLAVRTFNFEDSSFSAPRMVFDTATYRIDESEFATCLKSHSSHGDAAYVVYSRRTRSDNNVDIMVGRIKIE